MKVTLKIYSGLRNYVKNYDIEKGITLEVDKGKTIKQLLKENINHEKAIEAISMVTLNDRIVSYKDYNRKLKDGNLIKVFPPIGGGWMRL